MADFTSGFWGWFILVTTLVSLLVLVPILLVNRGQKPSGDAEPVGHVWDDDLEELNNPLPAWWLNMFLLTIGFSVIYLCLYPGLGQFPGLLGWTSLGEYQQEIDDANERFGPLFAQYAQTDYDDLTRNPDAMKAGERLFNNYCAVCHGSDARGAPGFPNLRDNDWQYGGTPDAIRTSIVNGRNGVMPGFSAALGEAGVNEVTQFVLSLAGRDHDAALAAAGQPRYMQLCIACHGVEGAGNPALGAPNLTDRRWLYGGSPRTIADVIAQGRNGVMPPHGEFLGGDKVHLLTAYVYGLSAEYENE